MLIRTRSGAAVYQDEARLQQLFEVKYEPVGETGWGPRLRQQFGHFSPDDLYEAAVEGLIDSDTAWLDVGGGSTVFPDNPNLARIIAGRCKRLVVVDPSSNVHENFLAHEKHQTSLEEFQSSNQFDLATARMVVEHVEHPAQFVAKLGSLVKPGGKVVVYTVNRYAPMTVLSACTPLSVHHFAKKRLWETEEKDTFPVQYLMNTRSRLNGFFSAAGFQEIRFERLDDCRTLARWKATLTLELVLWKALRSIGIGYPESCLLGVYRRH
jgi:2-polyprenyl-3-methyl-5-hydroxy-6-metoxy-1,4-benzoquinol methylase